jgi:hypothetical protein
MTDDTENEISGLALLRQPATLTLARHLNDLRSVLGYQAYLWQMIVKVDYAQVEPAKLTNLDNPPAAESAIVQMGVHAAVLDEMLFCREVNSSLTYLADLMTLIYEKYPKKLPSNKQASYRFCIEHHLAGDLISALAEETVRELTHQNLDDLEEHFRKKLDVVLFTKENDRANASLCIDLRNIITHSRGIVNRFFIQRNSRFADALGRRVDFGEEERREMLGALGFCARQVDLRAIQKFGLETIEPEIKESATPAAPDGGASVNLRRVTRSSISRAGVRRRWFRHPWFVYRVS